jgi:predicted small lipoprotein YifL
MLEQVEVLLSGSIVYISMTGTGTRAPIYLPASRKLPAVTAACRTSGYCFLRYNNG